MIQVDIEPVTTGYPGYEPLARAQSSLKTMRLPDCLGLAYRSNDRVAFPFLPETCAGIAMLLRRDLRPIPPHIMRVMDEDRGAMISNAYTVLGNATTAFYAIWHSTLGARLTGFLIRPLSALVVLCPEGDLPSRGTLLLSDLASGHEAIVEADEMAREFKDHLVLVNRN